MGQKSKPVKKVADIVPIADELPPTTSIYIQTNETSEQATIQEEAASQNQTVNKTKLCDGSVGEVIDQVYSEHEAKLEE